MNHPVAHPRNVIGIGILFALIAGIYLVLSHDVGGATMIGALAIAMTLMAYVLTAGSPRG
jgi:heme/copper-type cytochrome/quinol oxidase subunit 1